MKTSKDETRDALSIPPWEENDEVNRPHAASMCALSAVARMDGIPEAEVRWALETGALPVLYLHGRDPVTDESGDLLIHFSDVEAFLDTRKARATELLAAERVPSDRAPRWSLHQSF